MNIAFSGYNEKKITLLQGINMTELGSPKYRGNLGTKDKSAPIAVKLCPVVDDIVKSLPNRSDWLRLAIESRLIAEGKLTKTVKVTPEGAEIIEYCSVAIA